MNKLLYITLFVFGWCYKGLSQKKDSLFRKPTPSFNFVIHHDFGGTLFYFLAKPRNNASTTFNWLYLTGGVGIKKNLNALLLDYIILNQSITYHNGVTSPTYFANDSKIEFESSKCIWLSYRRYFSLKKTNTLFTIFGLGSFENKYLTDNEANKLKKGWCNVIDFGYSKSFCKYFDLNFYVGMTSAFSSNTTINFRNDGGVSAQSYYLKESDSKHSKTVTRNSVNQVGVNYKFLGVTNSSFIPRVGLDLFFLF